LVSIIINNYNYGLFLQEAITSAQDQTYPYTEVVVVDDGSTDNSQEIILSYGDKIIPLLKENGGQASALNAGFSISQGEVVIFLDADDYLFPHTVERVVAAWTAGGAKVQYHLKIVDALGHPLGFYPPPGTSLDSGEIWPVLLEKGYYLTSSTSGNAFRRAVLDQIFPIPEDEFRISADGYLVNLVPFYGQVISIQEALGAYRLHGSNAWGEAATITSDRFSKYVRHGLQTEAVLARKATELGYRVPNGLSLRNYLHMMHRVVSLRLNPQKHPISSDHPLSLIYWGLRAIWRYSELDYKRRLLFSIWFVWVGVVPLRLARPAIAWKFAPLSRPRTVDWIRKIIRSL